MSKLQEQVRAAQRKLWINRWLVQWGWALLVSAGVWAIVVLTERLFVFGIPLGWTALACFGGGFLVSVAWLIASRDPIMAAAVALDKATGLHERVSTCVHVRAAPRGPFEHAVIADAENRIAGVPAARFVPLRWTSSLSLGSAMSILALLLVLLPPFDLLKNQEAQAGNSDRLRELNRIKSEIQPPVSILTKIAEKNPDLDVRKDLKELEDALRQDTPKSADAIRRETAKTLDRFQDALKNKADSDQFKALRETKKRLRQIAETADPKSQLSKLSDSLAAGDFAEAQKEINKLKEELAKRAKAGDSDPQQTKKLQNQLEELSKQIQQAAQDKQSQRELENAGLSEADAKRILQNLAKKDPEQLKKTAQELAERLKNSGMTQEQIQQMLQKMQQRQKACNQCNKMSQQMQQAAQQMGQGNLESAMDELGQAGEMLNEMEQMEQALNDIESQMADLNNSRDDMQQGEGQQQCQNCGGTGFRPDGSPCPHCNGSGQGPQGGGRGSGARQRNDDAKTDTRSVKADVKTRNQGRIIGKQFVKGMMMKGESAVELHDAAAAAEIEATDDINRGRIPRSYRENVKRYFDKLGDDYNTGPAAGESKQDDGSKTSSDAASSGGASSGAASSNTDASKRPDESAAKPATPANGEKQ